jgi:FkbM family methyltransferase
MTPYAALIRNIRNWPAFLAFKLWPRRRASYQFVLKPTPVRVTMPRTMVVLFKEIFLNEAYAPAFEGMTGTAPVVIDIGGNMGYFALYTFCRYPAAQVHSFEPVEANQRVLNAHQRAHPAFAWTLHPVAVAGRAGTLDFFYDAAQSAEGINTDASLFSAEELRSTTARHQRISVEAVRLDEWMAARQLTHCDLLKLDCEGAEYEILYTLPDALYDRISAIVAEVHPLTKPHEQLEPLADFLRTKGYRVRTTPERMLYARRL